MRGFSSNITAIKYAGVGLIIAFFLALINEGIGALTAFISFMIFFFSGITFLLEAPSYATFKKQKSEFYNELRFAILNTTNFYEFDVVFNKK